MKESFLEAHPHVGGSLIVPALLMEEFFCGFHYTKPHFDTLYRWLLSTIAIQCIFLFI